MNAHNIMLQLTPARLLLLMADECSMMAQDAKGTWHAKPLMAYASYSAARFRKLSADARKDALAYVYEFDQELGGQR